MVGSTVPACSAYTTLQKARSTELALREPGQGVDVRVRPDGLRRAPHRPRSLRPRSGTSCAATSSGGARGQLRVATSPTSKTRSSAGRTRRRADQRDRRHLREGVVGRDGPPRRVAARRRSPTPPRTSTKMVDYINDLVDRGVAYEIEGDGVYFERGQARRLRTARPPVARFAAQRRGRPHGRRRRRKAVAARLRALEEGQAGRAQVGVAVGRRAARAGTSSAP